MGCITRKSTCLSVIVIIVSGHKCSGCAYEKGYQSGLVRAEELVMNIDELPDSQAGTVRHKSPHAAFALGYHDGVHASYNTTE